MAEEKWIQIKSAKEKTKNKKVEKQKNDKRM